MTLGDRMRSPAHQRRRLENRALMHLSLATHRALLEAGTPGFCFEVHATAAALRAIADELDAITPQVLAVLREAA